MSEDAIGASGTSSLERCPVCRYSLLGLPTVYRCPECGFDYDGETIVLAYALSKTNRWALLLLFLFFFTGPLDEILQGITTRNLFSTRFAFSCLATLFYVGFTGFMVRFALYPPAVIVNSVGVHLRPFRRIRKTYDWSEIIDIRIEGHGDTRRVCKLYHVGGVQSFRFYLTPVLGFELWKAVKKRLEARGQEALDWRPEDQQVK